jgi:hypothetical protein
MTSAANKISVKRAFRELDLELSYGMVAEQQTNACSFCPHQLSYNK